MNKKLPKIKEPLKKVKPIDHEGYILVGVDPGNNCALSVLDFEVNLHKVATNKGWGLEKIWGLFQAMVHEYEAMGLKIVVAVEDTPLCCFGKPNISKALSAGQLVGRTEALIEEFTRRGYDVISITPRENKHLKIKADVFNHNFPDFETKGKKGVIKSHQTNEHERDAVGIAICGLEKLKHLIIEREYS